MIDTEAQLLPESEPRPGLASRRPADGHLRVSGREALNETCAAQGFLPVGREVDRVSALGEFGDRRLEEPQIREMPGQKQNLHEMRPIRFISRCLNLFIVFVRRHSAARSAL